MILTYFILLLRMNVQSGFQEQTKDFINKRVIPNFQKKNVRGFETPCTLQILLNNHPQTQYPRIPSGPRPRALQFLSQLNHI